MPPERPDIPPPAPRSPTPQVARPAAPAALPGAIAPEISVSRDQIAQSMLSSDMQRLYRMLYDPTYQG
jgi:hypothetical protein